MRTRLAVTLALAALVGSLTATAEEMSGQAEQLQQLMDFFKVSAARAPLLAPRQPARSRSASEAGSELLEQMIPSGFIRFQS